MSWKDLFVKPTGPESPDAPAGGVDIDALLASTRALTGLENPESVPPPSTASVPTAISTLVRDRPLGEIYKEHLVPPSPKTVDEILAFLAGISNMPATAQAQIITAMDLADDNWEISDVLADADAKITALNLAKQGLNGQLQATLAEAQAKITAADQAMTVARDTIGSQIHDLEQQIADMRILLGEEESLQETGKTAALADQANARSVSQTEASRYDTEINKLQTFIHQFSN